MFALCTTRKRHGARVRTCISILDGWSFQERRGCRRPAECRAQSIGCTPPTRCAMSIVLPPCSRADHHTLSTRRGRTCRPGAAGPRVPTHAPPTPNGANHPAARRPPGCAQPVICVRRVQSARHQQTDQPVNNQSARHLLEEGLVGRLDGGWRHGARRREANLLGGRTFLIGRVGLRGERGAAAVRTG